MYGVHRTTVYLPDDLKKALSHAARRRGVSEAELIREGVKLAIGQGEPPRPRLPLFASGQPDLAQRFDELMEGFGED